jgi:hypothetical protein
MGRPGNGGWIWRWLYRKRGLDECELRPQSKKRFDDSKLERITAMTNEQTTSKQNMTRSANSKQSGSDQAPMVITRLSGWIDPMEIKTAAPAWIVPTRVQGRH